MLPDLIADNLVVDAAVGHPATHGVHGLIAEVLFGSWVGGDHKFRGFSAGGELDQEGRRVYA